MNPCRCGRLHDDDLDRMAHELADHIIETEVVRSTATVTEEEITALAAQIVGAQGKKRRPRRVPDFDAYYRFLAPYEARYKKAFRKYWNEQGRTVIRNMKRTPGGQRALATARTKGKTFDELYEQWMFPTSTANKQLEVIYKQLADKLLYATAAQQSEQYGLAVNWQVFNENIGAWLDDYSIQLADEINTETLDKLKDSLFDGWEAGESIDDLTARVRDLYEDFEKYRAEMVARTETIRGSNEGALETYEASGVVDRVMWVATPEERTCESCVAMDGKTVALDGGSFFPADGYSDGTCPPLHPNCRCTIVPILEGEEL